MLRLTDCSRTEPIVIVAFRRWFLLILRKALYPPDETTDRHGHDFTLGPSGVPGEPK